MADRCAICCLATELEDQAGASLRCSLCVSVLQCCCRSDSKEAKQRRSSDTQSQPMTADKKRAGFYHFTEDHIRFILACTLRAIAYLHDKSIAHRGTVLD